MNKITICICTRNRTKSLLKMLSSIKNANYKKLPINYKVDITIIENDTYPKSIKEIEEFQIGCDLRINYYLEKKQGICFARNRAINESINSDFILFVDDDQVIKENLLEQLIKCQQEFNADLVYGSNPPVFNKQVKPWIEKFHTPKFADYGTQLKCAPTNCLFIKTNCFLFNEAPFDLRLNQLGGEDILLTTQLTNEGRKLISNPMAIAYEIIPEKRTSLNYIVKRSFRNGNTSATINSILGWYSKKEKWIYLSKTIMRLILGLIEIIPFLLFAKENKLKGLIRINFNRGVISGIRGAMVKFYK